MKKVLPAILAVVLVLGAGLALAGEGVPSAKCAASVYKEDITPETNIWYNDTALSTVIKTSEKADLIISLTAECALATDVKIKGKGIEDESTSWAQIKIRAWVDDREAEPRLADPGEVVFAHRTMRLKGLLWAPGDVDPGGLLGLDDQYIEIYEKTRTANGFNFVMKNVGAGVHNVTVQIMTDVEPGFDEGKAWAIIGKRTLVVESVRMVND